MVNKYIFCVIVCEVVQECRSMNQLYLLILFISQQKRVKKSKRSAVFFVGTNGFTKTIIVSLKYIL